MNYKLVLAIVAVMLITLVPQSKAASYKITQSCLYMDYNVVSPLDSNSFVK